jgi:hypothetical protein
MLQVFILHAADSSYQLNSNKININDVTGGTTYGMWVTGSEGTILNEVQSNEQRYHCRFW